MAESKNDSDPVILENIRRLSIVCRMLSMYTMYSTYTAEGHLLIVLPATPGLNGEKPNSQRRGILAKIH